MEKLREILDLLAPLGARIRPLWEEVKAAPMILWRWTEGSQKFRWIFIGVAAAAGIAALYLLIRLLVGKWKEKFRTLVIAAAAFLIFSVLLIAGEREVLKLQLPEETAVSLESAEGAEVLAGSQYLLARGRLFDEDDNHSIQPEWYLTGGTFTFPVDDELVLQLTGLDKPNVMRRFFLNEVRRLPGETYIGMTRAYLDELTEGARSSTFTTMTLTLELYPGRSLASMPWYGTAGSQREASIPIPDWGMVQSLFQVLECGEDRLLFTRLDAPGGEGADYAPYLCLARQIGQDTVCCSLQVRENFNRYELKPGLEGEQRTGAYDPIDNEEQRGEMLAMLEPMLTEQLTLLRGLSEEERAAILPDRLSDYPVVNSWRNGGFSIPCLQLEEMGSRDPANWIKLIGERPEGGLARYTLLNGMPWAMAAGQNAAQKTRYEAWIEAFEEGEGHPDERMSAFLGATAVAYEDGWLLNPGPFQGSYRDEAGLYYLTLEPLDETG